MRILRARANDNQASWPSRRARRAQSGFSLIEVSIAALVIGVLVCSILSTVTHGFTILSRSRETVRANQLLQQQLETIRTYNWSQMTNNANFGTTTNQDGGILFYCSSSVQPYTNSTTYGTNNMRKVTVTVTWTNVSGLRITKSMTTLVAQGGLNDYIY